MTSDAAWASLRAAFPRSQCGAPSDCAAHQMQSYRFAYVRMNPFRVLVTVKLPSASAEILIQ